MIHVGKLIKGIIKDQGLSVKEAQEVFGLSRTGLYELYKNETPSTHHLFQLYKVLGVNVFADISAKMDGMPTEVGVGSSAKNGAVSLVLNLDTATSKRIIKTLIRNTV